MYRDDLISCLQDHDILDSLLGISSEENAKNISYVIYGTKN